LTDRLSEDSTPINAEKWFKKRYSSSQTFARYHVAEKDFLKYILGT
jgi:hypothetical protein